MSSKWLLSASQIQTFLTCKRKWAWQYLEGKKTPTTKAQSFGLEVHNALFNYLSNQIINSSSIGQIIRPGLVFLPKSLPKENIENHFAYAKDGHIFHGYMDFYEDIGHGKWLVGDHKTCSAFSRILTKEELKKDIQANIYAQYFFTQRKAQDVHLKWIYYRTKSTPEAICVESSLSKEEAEHNFKPIKKACDEIVKIIETKEKQPKNTSSCFKFGKCSFFDECKSDEVLVPNIKNKNNGFHLYLDCLPIKDSYKERIELSKFLKPVLEKLHQEKNLRHYRLAGYGQHVGLIADYLSQYLKKKTLSDNTAILSNTKTPEGIDTLETLSAYASQIVRGF